MDWSQKRKIIYAVGFAAVLITLASYPTYTLLHKTPTCSDGKKNGTETGVDCGGGCALICLSDAKAPRVVWAKAFSLGGNVYDLGAYVENPNTQAGVKNARYTIRVYNTAGSLAVEKKGTTEIAPGSGVIIFEPNVMFEGVADRVEIIFNQEDISRWISSSVAASVVSIKNKNLTNADTKPRFDAVVVNSDRVNSASNLVLSAVVYNGNRNPIAVSKTYVDFIPKSGEQNVVFTWPNKFDVSSGNFITEIIVSPQVIFME